jgi:hypothetical protein
MSVGLREISFSDDIHQMLALPVAALRRSHLKLTTRLGQSSWPAIKVPQPQNRTLQSRRYSRKQRIHTRRERGHMES